VIPAIPPISSSVSGVSSIAQALSTQTPAAQSAATQPSPQSSFGSILAQAVDQMQTSQVNAQSQAVQVAAGGGNVTSATIAATQATLETELAVSLRNAVTSALNQVMATPF
jgi:flagellar hook-basal body complex protein FliE